MSSVRSLAVAMAGMLLFATFSPTASPAGAAGTNGVTVEGHDGVRWDRCFDYQYRYSFDASGYDDWDATATFRAGPNDKKVGTDYLYRGKDETSGTSTKLICPQHPVGRYVIRLEVTFYDADGYEAGSVEGSGKFRLRKPRTRTSFTVDDRTPRYHQILTFRIVSKIEAPKGWVPNRYELVTLEARRAGGWERIRGSKERVNRHGVSKMKGRWERRAPLDMRATTLGESVFRGSVSRAKTLG